MKHEQVKAGFEQWAVFEKARSANRMHHREAYETLERALATGFKQPPRILDIGCGDARDIAEILKRVLAACYTGIDNSVEALDNARANIAGISCPWRLIHGDYTDTLNAAAAPFDLIWLGLFLHHLPTDQKRRFFQRAAQLLLAGGAVLAHDPVLLETENREGFLTRIAQTCQCWPEISAEEKDMLARHWSQHGHQERMSRLEELANQAGFSNMEILWRDPDGFYAVLAFRR